MSGNFRSQGGEPELNIGQVQGPGARGYLNNLGPSRPETARGGEPEVDLGQFRGPGARGYLNNLGPSRPETARGGELEVDLGQFPGPGARGYLNNLGPSRPETARGGEPEVDLGQFPGPGARGYLNNLGPSRPETARGGEPEVDLGQFPGPGARGTSQISSQRYGPTSSGDAEIIIGVIWLPSKLLANPPHNWYLATVPRKMLTSATSESATGSKLARSAVADTSLPDLAIGIVHPTRVVSGNKSVPVSHVVKGACRVMEPQLFRWKSCPIVLMSYVGESLHGKTLPIRDATEMGASLLETVLKLHKLGIIHRDISPRKVAYHEGKEGVGLERFYLLDFRIAVFVSDNCGSTMVKVTGMDLPWSAAAQEEDGDLVVTIRRQVLDKGFLAEFEEPSFNQLQQAVFNVHPDVPSPHMDI
ncbi:hypothetical protein SELMODRAFT_426591 [Selaginella moellendorffii]|uniref:Protein kinase domain-containing protein n=1 Tax=Selaginella moellendorffii TaxID=88036 RepID=D8SWV7_SELML|nr:hypothetical protein SELMODRAFT_426591 [Selaginella moellendorffii]